MNIDEREEANYEQVQKIKNAYNDIIHGFLAISLQAKKCKKCAKVIEPIMQKIFEVIK